MTDTMDKKGLRRGDQRILDQLLERAPVKVPDYKGPKLKHFNPEKEEWQDDTDDDDSMFAIEDEWLFR